MWTVMLLGFSTIACAVQGLVCPEPQVYMLCGRSPPITCRNLPNPELDDPNPPCVSRCQCPPETPVETYNADGTFDTCMAVRDCCPDCCEPPLEYVAYIPCLGPYTCDEFIYGRLITCFAIGGPGCSCPEGTLLVRGIDGEPDTCISPIDCLRPTCRPGEKPTLCGSRCNATCEDPSPVCTKECVARCQCTARTPLWDPARNKCIRQEKCDPCVLPVAPGPCEAYIPSWFFNASAGQCEEFIYGGCEGNANNFETLAACQDECEPCPAPMDCADSFCPAGFKTTADGCRKNCKCKCPCKSIECDSEEVCVVDENQRAVCVQPVCEFGQPPYNVLPPGSCATMFCPAGTICVQAGDAANCCPTSPCELEPDSGCGGALHVRWYFDPATRQCLPFRYGGSGGNENRFPTEFDCLSICLV